MSTNSATLPTGSAQPTGESSRYSVWRAWARDSVAGRVFLPKFHKDPQIKSQGDAHSVVQQNRPMIAERPACLNLKIELWFLLTMFGQWGMWWTELWNTIIIIVISNASMKLLYRYHYHWFVDVTWYSHDKCMPCFSVFDELQWALSVVSGWIRHVVTI